LAHATPSYTGANVHIFDPKRTWIDQSSLHCERALALDPDLPGGHLACAWILWGPEKNFQNAEAIAALEKVLTARPNLELRPQPDVRDLRPYRPDQGGYHRR